jgi:tetratricopeptide (TPR) repeat protein
LAARNRGDEEAARRAFTSAREQAAERVRSLPNDAGAASVLGMTQAALGEKEDAIRAGIRATELEPISKDALDGPLLVGFLAIIYAWTGEKDLALDQLKRVTEIPSYWSYGNLVLHPYWDPLRGDPRFEKIVASLAPQK